MKELWEVPPRRRPARPGDPHRRLADGRETPTAAASSTTWRATRSRSASWSAWTTSQPVDEPVRGDAALEDAPGLVRPHRGRQAPGLWRARHQQRRRRMRCPRRCSRWRADRLRRGLPQRVAHQGSHAAIKTGMLAAEAAFDAIVAGRAHDELSAYPKPSRPAGCTRSLRAQQELQALVQEGQAGRQPDDRHRAMAAAQAGRRRRRRGRCTPPGATNEAEARAECRKITYQTRTASSPSTGCRSVFISNTNHEENQPAHLTLKDPRAGGDQPRIWPNTPVRKAATARPASTSSCRRSGTAQRLQINAELRALQDLRHQGPDAEHRLGDAGRRRRITTPDVTHPSAW